MSPLTEPLRPAEARKLLRAILASGEVVFTSHALDEMEQDGISQADAYMLMSIRGDLRVNQACRSPVDVSVRFEFPRIGR